MKKTGILLMIVLGCIFISACTSNTRKENEALKAEIELLAKENAGLTQGNYTLKHSIENYQKMLNEIDQQIAAIDQKHELIKNKSAEYKNDKQVEEDILLHIEHLHKQMENAKHKITYLNKNMNSLRKQNADQHEELHKMDKYINDLANLVVKRDSEIVALHGALMTQGMTIDALSKAYVDQANYNDVLVEIINTGFFVSGTRQELKDMGIIDMEGGFIGLGRVKTLNANAPVEFLTAIDIRDTDIIELTGKKAELITPHPIDSYELTFNNEDKTTFLGIANKLKFWQETNYLVVEIVN